jgi:hypothetical protein
MEFIKISLCNSSISNYKWEQTKLIISGDIMYFYIMNRFDLSLPWSAILIEIIGQPLLHQLNLWPLPDISFLRNGLPVNRRQSQKQQYRVK